MRDKGRKRSIVDASCRVSLLAYSKGVRHLNWDKFELMLDKELEITGKALDGEKK